MSQATDSSDPEVTDKIKKPLTTEYLASHGISYEPNPEAKSDLPEHVAYLKSSLLDFECTISQRLDLHDDLLDIRDVKVDDALLLRLYIKSAEGAAIKHSIDRYEKVQEAVHSLIEAKTSEDKWQRLYDAHFFKPLEESVKPCDTDTRRVAREKFYYKSFENNSNQPWTLFGSSRLTSQGEVRLSQPKPDYAAFFKVFKSDSDLPSGSSNKSAMAPYGRWPWKNSPRRGLVRSFSSAVLDHLSRYGLEPCAANSRRRNENLKGNAQRAGYMCFPWLVVEHKTAGKGIQFCYCQAVNGAHAALTMLRNLAKHANQGMPGLAHIPPVTTITAIGPEVNVWVAYATDLEGSCRMTSIWAGSITRPSDIIKLEAILENLHTYAINELRPWISTYIEQWLELFPMDGSPPPVTIDEKPFPQLRSAQNRQPEAEKAADPQTPQSNPPQSAESQSASKSDILHMLQTEHRRLLGDVADLLRENRSTPGRETPWQFSFSSPSPSAGPGLSSSEPNMPTESPSVPHSDSSRPSGHSSRQGPPSTPTPASTRPLPGDQGQRPISLFRLSPTAVSGASSDQDHDNSNSSSIPLRSTQTPASEATDGNSKGVGNGPATAGRSERTNLGPRSVKSSTSLFSSNSSTYGFASKSPNSGFGSNAQASDFSSKVPASPFGSNAPTSGSGSKASTYLFGSSPSTGLFGTSQSKSLFDSGTSTFSGVSSNAPAPHSVPGPSAEAVDESEALEPDDTEHSEYVTESEHTEESEYDNGSEDAEYSDDDSIGRVPSSPPGKSNGKSSRRVKSHGGRYSTMKDDQESFQRPRWKNLNLGNQATGQKPKGRRRRTDQ